MNNTFNITRFAYFFRKTILERPMQLLGFGALILALDLLVYAFCKSTAGFEVAQNACFILGLVGGGCVLASIVFGHFSSTASGSSFLTLPVSQLEKWLCGVLITGVFYVALFMLFFRAMDAAFVSVYHNSLDVHAPFYRERYDAVQLFPFNGFVAEKAYLMFLNFAGVMLVGAFYFNKAVFIKVALIVCGFCFGIFLLNLLIANLFFSQLANKDTHVNNAFPYFLVWLTVGRDTGRLELPRGTLNMIYSFFVYGLPAIFWSLAFLRLREKEF